MLTAKYGVNQITVDKSCVTARDVLDAVQELWGVPANTGVRVNGRDARIDDTIPEGALVEFTKASGEKGCVIVALQFGAKLAA